MENLKVLGTFKNSRSFGFVVPDNRKQSKDIFVAKRNFNGAKNNQKVIVQITKFPKESKSPEGKIVEILGDADKPGMDMLCLIKEYHLPYEFPTFVLDEAKGLKKEMEGEDISGRKDFRDEIIFTIDGEDAKDLDDAICVKKKNGNYELQVHIADVSHYVKEGSHLDKEAQTRGTSVYMFDRVIPMLPKKLSNGICSLNAGKDRLTLSVIMEISSKGEVISSEICKGIINVTERMSYHDVTKILEKSDEKVITNYESYISHFELMAELAKILQEKREKQGYLDLDIPESNIILNKKGKVVDIRKYEMTVANSIIEQFMLTANEVVAERFYWLEAPFIYRVHEVPEMEKITELNQFLYNFGYKIKASKDNIHPTAFSYILDQVKGKPEEKVVSNLVLRTLKLARYENENKGHFGIASSYYCHFTSPIRRYPDLFIHRIISTYLERNYMVEEEYKEEHRRLAEKYAQSSSEAERNAQKAERESMDILKAEFMENKIGEIYEGIISGVTSFGVFVELENTVEGLIRFENLGEEYFIFDEERRTLTGERTKHVYKIGDKMKIQVIEANKMTRRVSFAKYENMEKTVVKNEKD